MDNVRAGCGGSSEAKRCMSDTESDEQQSGRWTGDDVVNMLKISGIADFSIFVLALFSNSLLTWSKGREGEGMVGV